MCMVDTDSAYEDIVVFTDWSQLSPARRAAFEQMHADMEADRAAENEPEQANRTLAVS